MIKNFTPMPFEGINPLPDYVTNVRAFTLVGTAPGGYRVTLAKLTVGESKSAGNPLGHALFESCENPRKRLRPGVCGGQERHDGDRRGVLPLPAQRPRGNHAVPRGLVQSDERGNR